MECKILKQYDFVSGYVSQVSSIADRNRDAFGFLSASVYEQMASKGQLWIAVNDENELKGYLMFGGTMPTLKVFQIYVCRSVKGQGIGKKLVDELKDFARDRNYHTISARVASDLSANRFWESNGFSIYRQVKGGDTKKRTINIRGYSLEDNDLFGRLTIEGSTGPKLSQPVLARPLYAIDVNLLLDVYKARPGYQKVIKMMQLGFQGSYSICITPEFKRELERNSANFSEDPVLRFAQMFPELRTQEDVSTIANFLRETVFPDRSMDRKSLQNDKSDLMHLAYCVSLGVKGFVTRERALLRSCNDIREKYGISIISPDELILDEGDMLDISEPLNADFSFGVTSNFAEIKNFLAEFSTPKVVSDLLFAASPVTDKVVIYEARFDGEVFGVYFFRKPVKATAVAMACLYVDETSPKAVAAIDHFLEKALRYRSGFSYRLDLYIGKGQDITEETLERKGFFKSEDHFVKVICNLFLNKKNWDKFSTDFKVLCGFTISKKMPSKKEILHTGICFSDSVGRIVNLSWFDFETMISPRFILDHDRNCILVPIRENYANGLIGSVTNQLSLLSSHDQELLLEKAYFRSSRNASLFVKGGIIAFYVSGNDSIQEIIGFARITYSDVVTMDEALVRLDRQGVLSRKELSNISDKHGKLHVFTFDNFLEFDKRISFALAKKMGLISNANLVSPEKIGSEKLYALIGEAFNE